MERSTAAHRLGTAAWLGLLLFVVTAVAVQPMREDLHWLDAPLSLYLMGPGGHWLQAAYFVLAAALGLLGAGYYLALSRRARSAAPWLLFVGAGLGLCVTALAHSNLPGREPTLEGWLHGTAAQTAFLCVTTAMLLQSWRLRGDPHWRSRFPAAFALALACFVAIWVDALWHGMPRGLEQRLVIGLILVWLLQAARWLRVGPARR
ncbi:DUF998 domain-containing protein [Rhodanobacter ginsengisoli]|uniref:DUF998 domain-containing protein n=1 Tax=Rhodanobacter ginsengisoli TaxID=418646 RepID=A0ABW0QRX5_9GAMM